MKYTDQLAKPIKAKRLPLLATDSDIYSEAGRITNERFAKLPDLCAAHGVVYGNWLALAQALAKEHVRGFKVESPAGRPTEWGLYDKLMFRLDVEDMQSANVGMPITQSIDRVRRLSQWADTTQGMKVTALSKHFYSVDLGWVQMARDARSKNQLSGANNS